MNGQPSAVILDPSPESRGELHRTLALAGVRVLGEAGHGVEGHTLIGETDADCVLLALDAPVQRGIQTLEAIVASHPTVPVIAYASTADVGSVRQALVAGAADYLVAPLTTRALTESIGGALQRFPGLARGGAPSAEPPAP